MTAVVPSEVLMVPRMPRAGGGGGAGISRRATADRLDQGQQPVRDPLAQGHLRAGADHARHADQCLDHVLQVGVVAGHDPREEITAAGDRERLDDLRHGRQRVPDLVEMALGDLDVHEREHGMAERGGGQRRARAGDHAVPFEAVEPGLEGAAGDAEDTGVLADAGARLLQQQPQDPGVELVHGHGVGSPRVLVHGPLARAVDARGSDMSVPMAQHMATPLEPVVAAVLQ